MKKQILFISILAMFFLATGSSAQVVVSIRPVHSKVVVKPLKASRGHTWVSGYWKWNHRRNNYIWTEGRWIKNRAHHRYISGHWITVRGRGHKWIPGYWARV